MTARSVRPLTTSTAEWLQFLSSERQTQGELTGAAEAFRRWGPAGAEATELSVWWDTREALAEESPSPGQVSAERESIPHRLQPCHLYFALKGRTFDPEPHIPRLLARGCFVIAEEGTRVRLEKNGGFSHCPGALLEVTEPARLLRAFCQMKLGHWASQVRTLGVTGTNGKTSVTHILAHILRQGGKRPVAQLGTLGFCDGVSWYPNTFPTTPGLPDFTRIIGHLTHNQVDTLVMEVSSHALAESRLGDWKLDVAILTNITPDHLDFHKTMDAYVAAKLRIFQNQLKKDGHAIVCAEKSPWLNALHSLSPNASFCLVAPNGLPESAWSQIIGAPGRHRRASALVSSATSSSTPHQGGLRFHVSETSSDGKLSGFETATFVVPSLYGHFQQHNALVCVAAASASGLSPAEITAEMASLSPIPGRMERVGAEDQQLLPTVFVDYAHTADALEQALVSLKKLRANPAQQIWVVFGCGGDRDTSKRPEMGRVASEHADRLIITSDNPRGEDPLAIISQIWLGISDTSKATAEPDRARAIERAVHAAEPTDLVLIAGKGHEDYQIIGNMKTHFSDNEQASAALEKRKEQTCSTP